MPGVFIDVKVAADAAKDAEQRLDRFDGTIAVTDRPHPAVPEAEVRLA